MGGDGVGWTGIGPVYYRKMCDSYYEFNSTQQQMNNPSVKEPFRSSAAFRLPITKPLPITKRISNYQYNEGDCLGQGSFAKVYKGVHKLTNALVAVKAIQLKPIREKKLTDLLVEETKIITNLDHPNVLKCYQVLSSENNTYIITELCDGGDLSKVIKTHKTLPLNKSTWKIIYEIYQGLKYINEKQIIHRDLKSANILFHKGEAKLADFGFAKQIYSTFVKDILVGSPFYMSPEGLINQIYGLKTDAWSFGIVLYEMFHGKTPFDTRGEKGRERKKEERRGDGDLKVEIMRPITHDKLNKDIPEDLKELILSCLAIKVENRISIPEIEMTPFFKRMALQLRGQDVQKTPQTPLLSSKFFSSSMLSPTQKNDPSSPFIAFGSHKINRSFKVQNISENANRMNTLMNPPQSAESHVTPDSKIQVVALSSKKDARVKGLGLPLTPTYGRTPPPDLGAMELKPKRISREKKGFRIANEILGYSVKTFKQCLTLLHYCRLCFKTYTILAQQHPTQDLSLLSSWIVKLLDEIQSLVERNQIDFSSSANPQEREQKLKSVVSEYIKKYSLTLSPDLNTVNPGIMAENTFKIWKEIDSGEFDLVLKHYSLYLAEVTWILREALEAKDMSLFVKKSNLQGFLGHKTSSLNETTYESLRNQLSH